MMGTSRFRVLQITDPHLFADPISTLMGINTSKALDNVLTKIVNDYQEIACLLVTGDLTQDGSKESYLNVEAKLSKLNTPNYWLCGNHDQPDLMEAISPSAMQKRITLGNWQILMLNTQVAGDASGYLSEMELKLLDTYLKQSPEKHTLLAIHHHPTPINCRWMDDIMLKNPEGFAQVISQNTNVKGIIHGHVHQARKYDFCNIPVMATPSTCVQFAPNSDDFQADTRQPGFRVLDLLPNGQIETRVVRVCNKPTKNHYKIK